MIKTELLIVLLIYLGFGIIEFFRTGFFHKERQKFSDAVIEVVSTFGLLLFIQPLIIVTVNMGLAKYQPDMAGLLSNLNVIAAFLVLLVVDDMTQYWWHRASHTFPWLYNLHRTHHNAEYMSVRLVYRNNLFYYGLMPSLWLSGTMIYMGLGHVYAVYLIMKLTIIIAAHSDVCWDRPLYKIAWLSPVMWLVERTVSTPSTHHAHHGKHKADGVTNYKGNFGNFLFFWDVLFGTAKITRKYPEKIGVENLAPTTLGEQLLWPLFGKMPIETVAETIAEQAPED